jgi:hypothetical protein
VGLLNAEVKGCAEDFKQWRCEGDCSARLAVLYCTLPCLDDLHEFYVFLSSGVIVWILFQYIFYIIELWAVSIIRIYLYVL